MADLNLKFRVINTIFAEKELTVNLYRAPGAHPSPFENIKTLELLKSTRLDAQGYGNLRLSEKEIDALRAGKRKVIYLVLSVDHEKQPVFITGAKLIRVFMKDQLFALDLKNDSIITDYRPDDETPPPSNPDDPDPEVDLELQRTVFSQAEAAKIRLAHERKNRKEVQSALQPALIEQMRQRKKTRGFVKQLLLKNLARKRSRRAPNFVKPGEDLSDVQEQNIERGLNRLREHEPSPMFLDLDEELFKELGIPMPRTWQELKPEEWEKIEQLVSERKRQRRKNPAINDCRKKHIAEKARDSILGDSSKSDRSDADPAEDAPAPGETASLDEIFNRLCEQLLERLDTGIQPTADDIAASVQQSISAGPADTTAYYDFHTLAIAWEDTWSAVYDESTEREVAKVYQEVVKVVGDEVAKELESAEYTELLDFVDSLQALVENTENLPGNAAPSELVAWVPGIEQAWPYLSIYNQTYLHFLKDVADRPANIYTVPVYINQLKDKYSSEMVATATPALINTNSDANAWAKDQVNNILAQVNYPSEPSEGGEQYGALGRLGRMLDGIHSRLYREPYEFDIFAPNSYNFGIVHTFQQRWTPLNYQVGDLISTLPLAPGEKKTYTTKRTSTEKGTSTKTSKSSLSSSRESGSTTRSQADIVSKASYSAATSATVNTNFGMDLGVFNGSGTSTGTVSGNAASESQKTKQNIRESTLKAAQEYKDEHSLELVTSYESTEEQVMTSEVSNPNNEITVTYLFYELQRRFEVSSKLDNIRPVVMVAFNVPQPSEIDEDWLLTYDWILRKSLLDPSLSAALDYIRQGFTGDELSVAVYKAQWEAQIAAVRELRDNVKSHVAMRDLARVALKNSTELVRDKFTAADAVTLVGGSMLGPLGLLSGAITGTPVNEAITSDLTKEEIAAAQESARVGMEWANADLQDAQAKSQAAVYALEQATKDYVGAISRRQQMRTRIDQLRIHVKENILYYMQAIWAHEPADQRYFRLYNIDVIWPGTEGLPQMRPYKPSPKESYLNPSVKPFHERKGWQIFFPRPKVQPDYPKRPLHQVADLDDLLGFKGNYAIFPLKEGNAITDYMSQDFLDDYFGIRDPDFAGNLPTETEAIEIARCEWEQAGNSREKKEKIAAWLAEILQNQMYVSDEIVVPSGELFVEALPGSHPLLEDFKLRHRAVDMEKAAQGLMHSRIEALRRIKRLVDDDLSDPDIDKKIEITGSVGPVNLDTE